MWTAQNCNIEVRFRIETRKLWELEEEIPVWENCEWYKKGDRDERAFDTSSPPQDLPPTKPGWDHFLTSTSFFNKQSIPAQCTLMEREKSIYRKKMFSKSFFPGAFGKVGRVRHSSPFNDKISIQRSVKRCLRKEILLKDVCTKKYYKFVDFFSQLFLKFKVSGSRDFHFTHVYPMPWYYFILYLWMVGF